MRGTPFRLAPLLVTLAAAASAQTPTPTPTPVPTPVAANTLATAVTHATEATANVNGVKIQVAPDGAVWFLEATADRLGVLRDHTITYWQLRTTAQIGANPVDFEIDGDTVWLLETGESTIQAGTCAFASLNTTTGELKEWVIPGSIPAAFYRAPDGKVWFPQTSGRLQSFDPSNLQVKEYRSALTFAYADMVVAPDGAFWLADFGNNRIVRWDPNDGATEKSWTMLDPSFGRLNPAQIQFDDHGFLWIAEVSANRMDRFDPATNQLLSYTGTTQPIHFDIFQGKIYFASVQSVSAVSVLDPRLGAPVVQVLTPATLTVGSTLSTIAVTTMTSVLVPTTFDSPEVAVATDKINVTTGLAIGSLTVNLTALAHTYGITVADGYLWTGVDGNLVRIVPQTIGGTTDQSVPVALSAGGAADSRIRVDVTVSNPGTSTIAGDALYLFSAGAAPRSAPFSLAPGATQELTDAFSVGAASLLVDGPVRLRVASGNAADLIASVRTTRILPNQSAFGFELPSARAAGSLQAGSSTTLFTGGRSTDISVLGIYTLAGASGTLTLAAPDGSIRGTRSFNLATNVQEEFNPAASAFNVAPEPGDVVRISVTTGSLQAYVNVLDPGTIDVATSQPVFAHTDAIVPNAGSVVGQTAKSFVSDLYLSNPGSGAAQVDLTFYPIGGGAPLIAALTLSAGESRVIQSFLPDLFGISSGQGSLFVTADAPIATAVRIAARLASGDYGTFAAALDGANGLGDSSGTAIGLGQTGTIRTHLLFFNRGFAGTVSVTGFRADGTSVGPVSVSLGDHAAGRLDNVFQALGVSNQLAGRIRVDVPAGMEVFAWTARVDAVTGDLEIAAVH